jgi:outer membrane biosynthesis protein TonB
MSFNHYGKFGEQQIPRAMGDAPEPGAEIGADVAKLEELSNPPTDALFIPLTSNDTRFDSAEMTAERLEELTAHNPQLVWPAVHSGKLHGNLALYILVDAEGHVREAWPLNSDNAGLDDPARDQVKNWIVAPVKDSAGDPIQVDGALGFRF